MSEWDMFQRADAPAKSEWDMFKIAGATEQPSYISDISKGFGTGVARGAAYVLGQGGDIVKAGDMLAEKLSKSTGKPVAEMRAEAASALPGFLQKYHVAPGPDFGSQAIMSAAEDVTGLPLTSYDPKTFLGRTAKTVGEFLPAALATRTGIFGGAVLPGLFSETAGELTKGTKAEPYARIGGAVAAPLAQSAAVRAVTPFPSNVMRQNAVQTLENEGINSLTAGQRVGNKGLQYLEDARGSAVSHGMVERQGEQFTAAVLRRAGINSDRATPPVIDDAFRRIGNEFDTIAARNSATFDTALAAELGQAHRGYNNLVAPPNRVPAVENFLTEIANATVQNGGAIPGPVYHSLSSRMADAARAMRFNNNEAAGAIREMREALDDAMERSMRRAGRTDDVASWNQARREYRNLLSIEGAAAKSSDGILSPQQMQTQVINTQSKRNYARGRGDFADLVKAGTDVMKPLPNSGTAQRNLAQNMGAGIPAIIGGYGGSQAGGAEGAAMGALAGFFAPRLAGRVMMSQPVQSYLSNQLVQNAPQRTVQADLMRALIAAQQAQSLPQR